MRSTICILKAQQSVHIQWARGEGWAFVFPQSLHVIVLFVLWFIVYRQAKTALLLDSERAFPFENVLWETACRLAPEFVASHHRAVFFGIAGTVLQPIIPASPIQFRCREFHPAYRSGGNARKGRCTEQAICQSEGICRDYTPSAEKKPPGSSLLDPGGIRFDEGIALFKNSPSDGRDCEPLRFSSDVRTFANSRNSATGNYSG